MSQQLTYSVEAEEVVESNNKQHRQAYNYQTDKVFYAKDVPKRLYVIILCIHIYKKILGNPVCVIINLYLYVLTLYIL